MATEQPSKNAIDKFDDSVDTATNAVIAEFAWIGLPEGDQLGGLMAEINDALARIMREWL